MIRAFCTGCGLTALILLGWVAWVIVPPGIVDTFFPGVFDILQGPVAGIYVVFMTVCYAVGVIYAITARVYDY